MSRNGGHDGTLFGRKLERTGSSSHPSSSATAIAVRRKTSAYSS